MNGPRSEEEFQNLLRRLDLALEASEIGVWEHDVDGDFLLWDSRMHRLYETGRAAGEPVSTDIWLKALHTEDIGRALADFESALTRHGDYSSEFRIRLPNGAIRYIRSRAHYFEKADGRRSMIGAEWDVTKDVILNQELKAQRQLAEERAAALEHAKKQYQYAASHDYLTSLANRRNFDDRAAELARDDTVTQLGLLHIDLDRFRAVNETAGRAAGDRVLQVAASCIASVATRRDVVARLGADEFLLLTTNFGAVAALRNLAETINTALQNGVEYEGQLLQTGASIGIAWGRRKHVSDIMKEAELALAEAKTLGRGRICVFSSELKTRHVERQILATELSRAILDGEIRPYYQVQVDARSRKVVGLEALARWVHPERGVLGPQVFMPIADDMLLTGKLDSMILKHVLADRVAWLDAGFDVPPIAVNVSPRRLSSVALLAELRRLAIPTGAIKFELLETMFLDDCEDIVLSNIAAIKEMGIAIAIDDFGSGHASIIGLVKSRPDHLKIDRRLVLPLTEVPSQAHLIRSVVEIARGLGMGVTAEGVETEEHAAMLAELGCDTLQGYALGRPAAPGDLMLPRREPLSLRQA